MSIGEKSLGELKELYELQLREAGERKREAARAQQEAAADEHRAAKMLDHIHALLGIAEEYLAPRAPGSISTTEPVRVERSTPESSSEGLPRGSTLAPSRKTTQVRVAEALPDLPKPMSQAEMIRWLGEHGVKVSRQAMSNAASRLVDAGKLKKVKSPEGHIAPYLYGRPDMFAEDGSKT